MGSGDLKGRGGSGEQRLLRVWPKAHVWRMCGACVAHVWRMCGVRAVPDWEPNVERR